MRDGSRNFPESGYLSSSSKPLLHFLQGFQGCLLVLHHCAAGLVSPLFGCDDQVDTHRRRDKSCEPGIGVWLDQELKARGKEKIVEAQYGEDDGERTRPVFTVEAADDYRQVKARRRSPGYPRQYRRNHAYRRCKGIAPKPGG